MHILIYCCGNDTTLSYPEQKLRNLKIISFKIHWGCGSVVEHLPSQSKALGSILSSAKKRKRKRKEARHQCSCL
jgi:hypothetical protein